MLIVDDVLATGGTAAATVPRWSSGSAARSSASAFADRAGVPRRPADSCAGATSSLADYVERRRGERADGRRVDRVLPWRRNERRPADEVAPAARRLPRAATPRRRTAPHRPGLRRGRARPTRARCRVGRALHPATRWRWPRIVADLGLDDVTIAAALLHDAVEDTGVTLDDLERDFGADVAAIVDGVTKLDRLQFDSKEAQQAATMRKMLVAMAKDLRVLLIKLADRLHNMRTIAAMPEWKQQRIAQETLDIYAPLAHRLGMQDVK